MRFIVTQIGARRGYAVPVILEKAGMLERFYTDLAANVGLGRWLVKCGPLLGFKRAATRLAGRRVPESILSKTVTFAWPNFSFVCNRVLSSPDPAARFREHLRWSRALGSAMVRRGFGQATHLYSMLGECNPMLTMAKRQRLTVVAEIYILLSAERIMASEHRAFPEWEPAPPDFDALRNEFPDNGNLLSQMDFAICPSDVVLQDLDETFAFPVERSLVVPYGMDRKWLTLLPQPVEGRVLFVGSAGLRKGIHYLAMAAERLYAKGRRYEFRVAGEVTRQIANQPSCRYLTFLGRIPRAGIHEEYAAADVFVLPSLAEGSAEATYEALAAGLPVVTTAAAGSVARDRIDGRIVPERDPVALAFAIEQLIQNRPSRKTIAKAARKRARDYTIERYAERLEAALRSFTA